MLPARTRSLVLRERGVLHEPQLVGRNPRVQKGTKSVPGPKHRHASSATGAAAMAQRWKWSEKRLRTKVRGNSTGFVRSRKIVPQPAAVHSASIAASVVGTVLT